MSDQRVQDVQAIPKDHPPTNRPPAEPAEVDPAAVFVEAMRGRHALAVVPGLRLDEASTHIGPDGVAADIGLAGHHSTMITMRWSPDARTTTADIELPTQGPFTLSNRDIGLLWDTAPVTAAMIRSAVTNAASQAWTIEHPVSHAEPAQTPDRGPDISPGSLAVSTTRERQTHRTPNHLNGTGVPR